MRAREIRKAIAYHRQDLIALQEEQEAELGRVRGKFFMKMETPRQMIRQIQATCQHKNKGYQSDPSGGSDSCEWCEDCGKELR